MLIQLHDGAPASDVRKALQCLGLWPRELTRGDGRIGAFEVKPGSAPVSLTSAGDGACVRDSSSKASNQQDRQQPAISATCRSGRWNKRGHNWRCLHANSTSTSTVTSSPR